MPYINKIWQNKIWAIPLAATIAFSSLPALAGNEAEFTTAKEVRTEISESFEAIADYTAQERDQAIAEAREAMNRLDAEIDRKAAALRENWSDMTESARESANENLRDLRQARNELGERFGALQASANDAWDDLKASFENAWTSLKKTWKEADAGS